MKNIKYLFFLISILLIGCKNTPKQLDDFAEFRQKFYSDTLFQVNHIIFPLRGNDFDKMEFGDTVYIWQGKEDWRFIGDLNKHNDVITDVTRNDSIVTELSHLDYGAWLLLVRFKKINNDWFLIRCEFGI